MYRVQMTQNVQKNVQQLLKCNEKLKSMSNVLQKSKSVHNVSLLLLKIEHSFFQESIDNNKSIGVTVYRCQIQALLGC